MARGQIKSPTKSVITKNEFKSKSQNRRNASDSNRLSDNTDSDQMELDITPTRSRDRSISPRHKTNGRESNGINNKNHFGYKNNVNCSGVSVDKREFSNIIKGAFSSISSDIESESMIIESNNNGSKRNNVHINDGKVNDIKSNSKIRAKRSYKSILSFFRKSDDVKENKEISLQNIESITSSEGKSSGNMENYFNRMNESGRSASSRGNQLSNGSTVQNQIIAMIHKCEAECASLENKIYLLETNYLNQCLESTGLTRGWNRCGILSNTSDLSSFNSKSRKLSSCRGKSVFGYNVSEVLATDRLFSLTSYDNKVNNEIKNQGNQDK